VTEYVDSTHPTELVEVNGYRLALDRRYDKDTHMWAKSSAPGTVRIGIDPLGVETSGTLAQLSFTATAGTEVVRGRPIGQLEAAKFVGPLTSPLSGTLVAVNDAVLTDPGLVEQDPYGEGWLIELSLDEPEAELAGLLSGPDDIVAWFGAKVDDYRLKGVIAR
jgi:glycine cleavage system H protein